MQKIPTLFRRDPDDMRYLTRDAHPDCKWVLDGEGVATRKYDGTCVALLFTDGEQVSTEQPTSGPAVETVELRWLARREVKPGKQPPAGFIPVEHDETTGKTVGWEPIVQSAFAKFHDEAITADNLVGIWKPGTYELCGPKVNGNPEKFSRHVLIAHELADELNWEATPPRDYDGLAEYLRLVPYEGIVWHHDDGRMAKVKARDFGVSRG